jgi:hypothetical protein
MAVGRSSLPSRLAASSPSPWSRPMPTRSIPYQASMRLTMDKSASFMFGKRNQEGRCHCSSCQLELVI